MFGIIIIIILFVYIAFSIWLAIKISSIANSKGRSGPLWSSITLLVMFLLVFWDYIPTIILHQKHCDSESGLTIYKSPEIWNKENPGSLSLLYNKKEEKWDVKDNITERHYNERFSWKTIKSTEKLGIIRTTFQFVDKKKNEVLAEQINFSTGISSFGTISSLRDYKQWMKIDNCDGAKASEIKFVSYKNNFVSGNY